MRKFFVCFLLLGLLVTIPWLTKAQQRLPRYVTANYPTSDYMSIAVDPSKGSGVDALVEEAKKELIQRMFQNTNSIFNPREKKGKNRWASREQQQKLEEDYIEARYNLKQMATAPNSHLAKLLHRTNVSSGEKSYTLVNVKRQELMRAYVEREKALEEQINVLVARAAQVEAVNQQQALQAYLQTLPLYEELKEAALLQQVAMSPSGQTQDAEAVFRKLQEVATGTNGGSLSMPLPDVNERVNQLQHKGRLMQTVDEMAVSMVQQLSTQTKGLQKGLIKINGFKYKSTSMAQGRAMAFEKELARLLEQDGWRVHSPDPPTRGMQRKKASFTIAGTVVEGEEGSGRFKAVISDSTSGDIVGTSHLNLDRGVLYRLQPSNYDGAVEVREAFDSNVRQTRVRRDVLTGQELKVEVWTNKDQEYSVFPDGEDVIIYCQVNQPAYIRLVYVLAEDNNNLGRHTLLHDSTYIDKAKVGLPVAIGEFVVAPPFGAEQLIVLARKDPHPQVDTVLRDGYYYLSARNAKEAMAAMNPPTRGLKQPASSTIIEFSTAAR